MRALKEGKDPNESNPKIESAEESLPALDPNDPEVLQLEGRTKPQPATVEDVPDEAFQAGSNLVRKSSIGQSLHASAQQPAQVSAPGSPEVPTYEPYPKDGFPYTAVRDDKVSPLEPSPNERGDSVGGGYFPEVPTFTSEVQGSTLQTASSTDALDLGLPDHPSAPPGGSLGLVDHLTGTSRSQKPPDFELFPSPAVPEKPATPSGDFYRQAPPSHPAPHSTASQHLGSQPSDQPPSQRYNPPLPSVPLPKEGPLITNDLSIAKAQKHCRWAISALNFEDAETAVKELREALKTLGAA